MEKWIVAYAKLTIDKEEGVVLQGVYFGGIGSTIDEAEGLARECVNMIKGGTILPKVFKITEKFSVIDALYDAADKFEGMTKRMQDAEVILNRNKKKTHHQSEPQ